MSNTHTRSPPNLEGVVRAPAWNASKHPAQNAPEHYVRSASKHPARNETPRNVLFETPRNILFKTPRNILLETPRNIQHEPFNRNPQPKVASTPAVGVHGGLQRVGCGGWPMDADGVPGCRAHHGEARVREAGLLALPQSCLTESICYSVLETPPQNRQLSVHCY